MISSGVVTPSRIFLIPLIRRVLMPPLMAAILSSAVDAAAEIKKLGGAKTILSTAPSGKAMASLIDGLGANGTMTVLGAGPDPIEVQTAQLIFGNKDLKGWASGIAPDSEDTLRFAAYTGVRPMIEKFPLDKVNEAYNRMTSGKAQFRVVLTM